MFEQDENYERATPCCIQFLQYKSATQQQTVQKPNLKIQNDLYTTYQMMHQKNDY